MASAVAFILKIICLLLISIKIDLAKASNTTINSTNFLSHLEKSEFPGPWSEILENWAVFNRDNIKSRMSRVMKIGDTGLSITSKITSMNKRDVSETDLYLLSAIEKLVYRVDFVEKRLRRTEELLYYVISGKKDVKEPCPANYTRIAQNCYHFSTREFDWKSSASLCRGMGGNLIELETVEENQDIIQFLQSNQKVKRNNFWTGGLNPGLLWIWAGSARPVHQDTKQTVVGDGRCLKLEFDITSRIYSYKGEDCGSRQRYICELSKDDESVNKITRTSREMFSTKTE